MVGPKGDAPSETCHGRENPRPFAVSVSVFSAKRVVLSPKRMDVQSFFAAVSTSSRVRSVEAISARDVAVDIDFNSACRRSLCGSDSSIVRPKEAQSMLGRERASSMPRVMYVCVGKRSCMEFHKDDSASSENSRLTWTTVSSKDVRPMRSR